MLSVARARRFFGLPFPGVRLLPSLGRSWNRTRASRDGPSRWFVVPQCVSVRFSDERRPGAVGHAEAAHEAEEAPVRDGRRGRVGPGGRPLAVDAGVARVDAGAAVAGEVRAPVLDGGASTVAVARDGFFADSAG